MLYTFKNSKVDSTSSASDQKVPPELLMCLQVWWIQKGLVTGRISLGLKANHVCQTRQCLVSQTFMMD